MTRAPASAYRRAVLLAVLWVVLFAALIRSLDVAFAWWKGEIAQPGMEEWFWIALLPVCVFAYLRWFSVFRPGCEACVARGEEPLGPRGA